MKKIRFPLIVILIAIFAGCGGDNGNGPNGNGNGIEPVRLVVDTLVTAPTLTDVNESVWYNVNSVEVEIGGSSTYGVNPSLGRQNVMIKAIRKLDTLYIWVRWRDPDARLWANYIRKSAPQYVWEHVTSEGQDVFSIIFDVRDNGTEGADCASMCHTTSMKTTGGGHADVWKWMSTATSPGKMAEDQWWDATGTDQDATINLYVYRSNYSQALPSYMHPDTTEFQGPFLYISEEVEFDNLGIDWPTTYKMPGYRIDSTIFHSPIRGSTSLNDVKAISEFDNTGSQQSDYLWTVVFARALNTGHSDDINLAGVDSLQVTVAATHNYNPVTKPQHSGSRPFWLILKP